MKSKALALTFALAFLFSALTETTISLTYPVQANYIPPEKVPMEHAYIRSNGEIDPPTLPIQRQNNTYTLTANIQNYSLEIQTDNIIFNGNNHTLSVPPYENTYAIETGDPSIRIVNRENILIANTSFENCFYCIDVKGSSSITIAQNSMINGSWAIYMDESSNCTIIANNLLAPSSIRNSTFLEIAYNKISGIGYYGIRTSISYSNITKNEFINNLEAGITLQGSNDDNYIFHGHNHDNNIFLNNFIGNKVGILFRGNNGVNINNSIFNNYWRGNQIAIKNVDEGGVPYRETITDNSPLTDPVPILFDPTLLSPSTQPTPTPSPTINPSPTIPEFPPFMVISFIMAATVLSAILYRGKHSRLKQGQENSNEMRI